MFGLTKASHNNTEPRHNSQGKKKEKRKKKETSLATNQHSEN